MRVLHVQADAMTTTELDAFRHLVQKQLAESEEELGQPIMYTFSGAADAAAEGAPPQLLLLPFHDSMADAHTSHLHMMPTYPHFACLSLPAKLGNHVIWHELLQRYNQHDSIVLVADNNLMVRADFDFKGFPLATIASGMMDESIGR